MNPRCLFFRRRLATFPIALVVALAIACAAGCAIGRRPKPPLIDLAALVQGPNEWLGKQIEVRGTLRSLVDPNGRPYGVIENPDLDRVGLKEVAPWRSLVDQRVDATGTLRFDPTFGWYLDSPTIGPPPPH